MFLQNKSRLSLVAMIILAAGVLLSHSDIAYASAGGEMHQVVNDLLLGLVLIILGAKIGGDIALRLKQPAVLGELTFGVVLGNMSLLGITSFEFIKTESIFAVLSELGVIFLLFEVGLETNIASMMKVGASALLAAILGVVAPFALGFGVSYWFMPNADFFVHTFVGATLTATSVGITARVLQEMGKVQSPEGQLILGAAVIDDVLGLMTLAVVTGLIVATNSGVPFEINSLLVILGQAFGFLFGALILGTFLSPKLFTVANKLRSRGLLLATSLSVCFLFSYLAVQAGLAAIVGAFTAGLIHDPVHYKELKEKTGEAGIEHLVHPISSIFVPVFFVVMGAKVDISVFGNVSLIGYALMLTVAAILGKQVCGLGVLSKGIDRMAVGIGMIPRGEVGLIFVGIGAALKLHGEPVIDAATFGAVVIMVILTTMLTPPLIKWKFSKL